MPVPRLTSPLEANAAWEIHRCPSCGLYVLCLLASRPLMPREEIVIDSLHPVFPPLRNPPPLEVTFDGGARCISGLRVAGAGAVLWGPEDLHGNRKRVVDARVALPGVRYAQVAEAWGLRIGIGLLLSHRATSKGPCRALITGDNLGVVRYGASQGRLRKPEMQGLLEGPLGELALGRWDLSWLAVRRRFNKAADEQATKAVQWAGYLAKRGEMSPHLS